jgi:hypothetical protein
VVLIYIGDLVALTWYGMPPLKLSPLSSLVKLEGVY